MKSNSGKQLWIATCLYLGPVLYGFIGGWTSPVIMILKDPEATPLPGVITEEQASWIGSVIYIGLISGPHITGYLSNVVGRKPCLLAGGVIIGLSSLALVAAKSLAMVYVGRITLGVGCGIIYVINLIYIAEIASTSIRGLLLTLCAVSTSAGTFIAYCIAPHVSYSTTMYTAVGCSVFYIMSVLLFVPDTPTFYILKGDEKTALNILTSLGRSKDLDELLSAKIVETEKLKREWLEMFTKKSNRKALMITLILVILEQGSGVSSILFFATSVFDLTEYCISPNVSIVLIGATLLFASSISSLVVEKFGRKILLLVSTAMCCLCSFLLGIYFFLDHINHSIIHCLHWLPVTTLGAFILSFNLGFGVIPGTFIGEMFQSNIRSLASTIILTVGWFFGLIVTTSFGYLLTAFGIYIPFWIYSCSCLGAFVFTAVFVPETKGKTFSEIQCILNK